MGGRIRTHDDLRPFSFPNLSHSLNKIDSKRELRYDVKFRKFQRGEAKILFGNGHKFRSLREGNRLQIENEFSPSGNGRDI
jgi:hypothetical protein